MVSSRFVIVTVLCATAADAVAGDFLEDALADAAKRVHLSATGKRQAWESGGRVDEPLHRDALAAYARACGLYEQLIAKYPSSDQTYERRYQLGEVLYFSGHFLQSIPHYQWVRDHRDPRAPYDRTVDAARSVLNAFEAMCPVTTLSADELMALSGPLAMPRCHARAMASYSEYARLFPDDAYAPQMALNAALVALTYLHLDEADAQLRDVMTRFPASAQARTARDTSTIVGRLRAQRDHD